MARRCRFWLHGLIVALLGAVSASAAADELTAPSPGNDYEVACGAGEMIVRPISPELAARGPGGNATIDCPLPNELHAARVRFTANQAFPYRQCGGAPAEFISLWVDQRLVVSRRYIDDGCNGLKLALLDVAGDRVTVCSYIPKDLKTREDLLDERAGAAGFGVSLPQNRDQGARYRQYCENVPFGATTPVDHVEYPSGSARPPVAGTLQPTVATDGALCRAAVGADQRQLVVPPSSELPGWREWQHPAGCGHSQRATFDFANEGVARDVYDWDLCSHASDGDVYLTLPAGAPEPDPGFGEDHNSVAAVPPGARRWTLGYAHGQVFRRNGTTYLLETPVNDTADFYLKRPQPDGGMTTICSWYRVEVHM
jgi:hypothetical protein